MKSELCLLVSILCMFLLVTTAWANEEPPVATVMADVAEAASSDAAPADDADVSADSTGASAGNESENTGGKSIAPAEKTADVQTASWVEIKRKFKDR